MAAAIGIGVMIASFRDWFALQLDDRPELMVYLLERRDGTADQFRAGTLVSADGTSPAAGGDDVRVEVLAHCPHSG